LPLRSFHGALRTIIRKLLAAARPICAASLFDAQARLLQRRRARPSARRPEQGYGPEAARQDYFTGGVQTTY
jgi:hypothetical protein